MSRVDLSGGDCTDLFDDLDSDSFKDFIDAAHGNMPHDNNGGWDKSCIGAFLVEQLPAGVEIGSGTWDVCQDFFLEQLKTDYPILYECINNPVCTTYGSLQSVIDVEAAINEEKTA